MKVVYDDGFYKTAKISGPTHNFLAIKFSDKKNHGIHVVDLNEKDNSKISGKSLLTQVAEALAKFNRANNCHYQISEIQYIGSDTVSNHVYGELTRVILDSIYKKI